MAIIIPSSKTYDRQNPKVRDNVIERIEVETSTVVNDYKNDATIYDKSFYDNIVNYSDIKEKCEVENGLGGNEYDGTFYIKAGVYCGGIVGHTVLNIQIPKTKENKYISNVFVGGGQKENEEPNIKVTLNAQYKKYFASGEYNIKNDTFTISNQEIEKNEIVQLNTVNLEEKLIVQHKDDAPAGGEMSPISVEIKLLSESNIRDGSIIKEQEDFYEIKELKVISYIKTLKFDGYNIDNNSYSNITYIDMYGYVEEFIPKEIKIGINGNTIGIDLTDNVVKIGDSTSKKAQTVERNELMQTQNYVVGKWEEEPVKLIQGSAHTEYGQYTYTFLSSDNLPEDEHPTNIEVKVHDKSLYGSDIIVKFWEEDYPQSREVVKKFENSNGYCYINNGYYLDTSAGIEVYAIKKTTQKPAIEIMYGNTKDEYLRGKETATIRCSIGDYYEENGEKAISDDNTTGKMAFDLYDQVIPMVYGANGKDRPMSLYKDGTPKVFQVLGKKVFYDGAVWQELTLQEI